MRKALILFLAATAMTPFAAHAQPREGTDDVDRRAEVQERYERQAQRNAQRSEQRQQRQEARQQRQAQPVQAEAAPVAVVQRRDRGEQRQQRQAIRQERQGQRIERVRTQSAPVAVTQRDRGEWRRDRNRDLPSTTGWEGPRNDPSLRDDAARYDRRARENALRYGTRQQRQEVRQERREDRRDWRQDRRADRRDWRREWNRDSWRSDRRYDWQRYRYTNRNIFRVSPYYSPYRNHRYSRFSIGFFLDSLFYDRRYWIGDPWQYRLPAAPYGTQWVRYYGDVLLVDVYTGEVIDVIYDFFW